MSKLRKDDRLTFTSVVPSIVVLNSTNPNNLQSNKAFSNRSKSNGLREQKTSDIKIELNLPKAKITKKGQLLIYTNNNDDDELKIREAARRRALKSKKCWIDSLTVGEVGFSLDTNQILSDQVCNFFKIQ
jgi:hypothetical protein